MKSYIFSSHQTLREQRKPIIPATTANSLAYIVFQSDIASHSKPRLRQLHWLPVHSRIRCKHATITKFKCPLYNFPQCLLLHLSTTTNLSECPFSSLLWPCTLSFSHSINYQLSFSLLPLLGSCHLEFKSSRNRPTLSRKLIDTKWLDIVTTIAYTCSYD